MSKSKVERLEGFTSRFGSGASLLIALFVATAACPCAAQAPHGGLPEPRPARGMQPVFEALGGTAGAGLSLGLALGVGRLVERDCQQQVGDSFEVLGCGLGGALASGSVYTMTSPVLVAAGVWGADALTEGAEARFGWSLLGSGAGSALGLGLLAGVAARTDSKAATVVAMVAVPVLQVGGAMLVHSLAAMRGRDRVFDTVAHVTPFVSGDRSGAVMGFSGTF